MHFAISERGNFFDQPNEKPAAYVRFAIHGRGYFFPTKNRPFLSFAVHLHCFFLELNVKLGEGNKTNFISLQGNKTNFISLEGNKTYFILQLYGGACRAIKT